MQAVRTANNRGIKPIKPIGGFDVVSAKNQSHYKMTQTYTSGTLYRIYISNNQPAYVYAIGTDLTGKLTKIFPRSPNESAALTYKKNNIAIPNENYWIQFDNTQGTDYLCVLYSKEALDIDNLMYKIESGNGAFFDRLCNALGNKFAKPENIEYNSGEIRFRASSNGRIIVPVIVEIEHR